MVLILIYVILFFDDVILDHSSVAGVQKELDKVRRM